MAPIPISNDANTTAIRTERDGLNRALYASHWREQEDQEFQQLYSGLNALDAEHRLQHDLVRERFYKGNMEYFQALENRLQACIANANDQLSRLVREQTAVTQATQKLDTDVAPSDRCLEILHQVFHDRPELLVHLINDKTGKDEAIAALRKEYADLQEMLRKVEEELLGLFEKIADRVTVDVMETSTERHKSFKTDFLQQLMSYKTQIDGFVDTNRSDMLRLQERLTDKADRLEEQSSELERQLEEVKSSRDAAEAEAQTSKKDLEETEVRLAKVEADIVTHGEDVAVKKAGIERLEKKLKDGETRESGLKKALTDAKVKIDGLEDDLEEVKKELTGAKVDAETDVQRLTARIDKLKQAAAERDSKIGQARTGLVETLARAEDALSVQEELVRTRDDQISTLRQSLEESEALAAARGTSLESEQRSHQSATVEMERIASIVKTLQSDIETHRSTEHALETANANMRVSEEESRRELHSLREEAAAARSKSDSEISNLLQSLRNAETANTNLRASKEDLRRVVQALRGEAAAAQSKSDTRISGLRQSLQDAETAQRVSQCALETANANLRTSEEDSRRTVQALRDEAAAAQSKLDARISDLLQSLQIAETRIADLGRAQESSVQELLATVDTEKRLQTTVEAAKRSEASLESRLQSTSQELTKARESESSLQTRLQAMDQELFKVKGSETSLGSSLQTTGQELVKARESESSLESRLQFVDQELAKAQGSEASLKASLEVRSQEIRESEASLKLRLKSTSQELTKARESETSLNSRLEVMSQQFAKAQELERLANSRLQSMTRELTQVKANDKEQVIPLWRNHAVDKCKLVNPEGCKQLDNGRLVDMTKTVVSWQQESMDRDIVPDHLPRIVFAQIGNSPCVDADVFWVLCSFDQPFYIDVASLLRSDLSVDEHRHNMPFICGSVEILLRTLVADKPTAMTPQMAKTVVLILQAIVYLHSIRLFSNELGDRLCRQLNQWSVLLATFLNDCNIDKSFALVIASLEYSHAQFQGQEYESWTARLLGKCSDNTHCIVLDATNSDIPSGTRLLSVGPDGLFALVTGISTSDEAVYVFEEKDVECWEVGVGTSIHLRLRPRAGFPGIEALELAKTERTLPRTVLRFCARLPNVLFRDVR
ncbi:hypothetical protein MMC09_006494 [Bachmanniomyces sp. S44760]|nr:hypothetical protein [Bachmanniomyces sp. S44760]